MEPTTESSRTWSKCWGTRLSRFAENCFAAKTIDQNRKYVKNFFEKKNLDEWHQLVCKACDGTGKAGFSHYGHRKSKNRLRPEIDHGE